MEVIMKRQWKKIQTGLCMIVFSIGGLLEYVQLMQFFDLPQALLLVPLLGALSMIVLKKKCFFVPVCTILLAAVYQIMAGATNAVSALQTGSTSITNILLPCLSILILLQLIGMGGGALIRFVFNKKKNMIIRIVCCVLGVLVTIVPYIFLFHNPLYPLTARRELKEYAVNQFKDNEIVEKKVYYSMEKSDYMCRISMSDGRIRILYFNERREVTEE